MPHHKHHKNHRPNKDDANNNLQHQNLNEHHGGPPVQQHAGVNDNDNNRGNVTVQCCVPTGCTETNILIDTKRPGDSVRVVCNNEACTLGNWMHKACFDEWEQGVLSYLRSCGRARSWSEKQRLQNLWTKKGYDLAYKACDCKCSRGHLRKDLDYWTPAPTPEQDNANKKTKKKPKKNDKPMAVMSNGKTGHNHVTTHNGSVGNTSVLDNHAFNNNTHNNNNTQNQNANHGFGHPQLRLRTDSVSSGESSPPNSACSTGSGSPTPLSPLNNNVVVSNNKPHKPKFDFLSDQSQVLAGNIFRRRHDLSAFSVLPKHKQNPYHIKMEDDGPHGNDDTRSFVLAHLSSYKVTSLRCVLCKNDLSVFDRYPLIDGTFFLSPQAYDEGVVQVISEGRLQFINAVCVSCMEGGTGVRCASCKRKWDGSTLQLGSMYTYDIFAAMPCCQKRLTCKHCRRAVVDVTSGLQYYSEYSHMIACPYCKAYDYHFIRPLSETFAVKMSIWN